MPRNPSAALRETPVERFLGWRDPLGQAHRRDFPCWAEALIGKTTR